MLSRITSGQDLLAQARTLTGYLREQPDGWLAAHRLMKSLRHDTLRAIPAPDAEGKTRIEPPRADQRAMLKRLYLQQSWLEIQQLTNRLNALDEQKGKYMTVSELKSAVFAMSQSFSHTVPLEERLRLLSILPAGQPLSAAQLNQTEQHLQQLIASYALLKHQKE